MRGLSSLNSWIRFTFEIRRVDYTTYQGTTQLAAMIRPSSIAAWTQQGTRLEALGGSPSIPPLLPPVPPTSGNGAGHLGTLLASTSLSFRGTIALNHHWRE